MSEPLHTRTGDDELLDIKGLLGAVRRRTGVLVSVAGLIFALSVVITLQLTPLYTAT
jgi:uncharacterized protein involved in exopolysaccharide biosynthesis